MDVNGNRSTISNLRLIFAFPSPAGFTAWRILSFALRDDPGIAWQRAFAGRVFWYDAEFHRCSGQLSSGSRRAGKRRSFN